MRFLITFIICLIFSSAVQAKQIPEEEWTTETQLWAARMLYGEATWQFQDVQILYVIKKRWIQRNKTLKKECSWGRESSCKSITFLEVMRGYSKAINLKNGRYLRVTKQKEQYSRWLTIQELPWGDYVEWNSTYNGKWATWRKLVQMWYKGAINNVCPKATHWGGRKIDTIHQGFVVLRCENDAGGFLSRKKAMVNGMQARSRVRSKFKGKVNAAAVKKEFQKISYND